MQPSAIAQEANPAEGGNPRPSRTSKNGYQLGNPRPTGLHTGREGLGTSTPYQGAERPADREDCRFGARPCMYVACRFHLYLDVNPRTGSIKFNFPGKEVHELEETCALDVAERGGITLEEVGGLMNLTRERVRQLEAEALDDLQSIVDLTEEDITELGARIE